jgi:hypothetical protein
MARLIGYIYPMPPDMSWTYIFPDFHGTRFPNPHLFSILYYPGL